MKRLIDEHGKLWGLINPVDLAIILILMVLGLKILSDYRPVPLDFKENLITIGLLIKNIPRYLAGSVSVGQDLFHDRSNAYLGKIVLIKAEPAEILIVQNGRLIPVQSPRNVDLHLTIRNKGRIVYGPARSGVYLGKLAVRVGDKVPAHTRYSSLSVEIEYLRVKSHGRP